MSKSLVATLIVMMGTFGCGSGDSAPATIATNQGASNGSQNDPIAEVAYNFFDAVLASDKDKARAQLTPLAVQRMAELGMDFLLPVSESSKFTVGKSDIIEGNMAAVDAVLTEVDQSGQPIREEITVVLKRTGNAWGVMGVVTGMATGEQIDGFNFEKPDQPFSASTFGEQPTTNIASGAAPTSSADQQATRPAAEDPFRR